MDKELHEKALDAAIAEAAEATEATGVSMFISSEDRDKWVMEQAIAAYLKTAGLTVVPVEPTEEMVKATSDIVVGYDDFSCGDGAIYLYDDPAIEAYRNMLAAFPSPFKDTP